MGKGVKFLLILAVVAVGLFFLFSYLQQTGGSISQEEALDLQQAETEIQTIIQSQPAAAVEAGRLADQGNLEESKAKLEEIRQDLKRAKELNQKIIAKANKDAELFYTKRAELFDDMMVMFNKMEECIELFFQDQQQGQACIQESASFNAQIEEKAKQLKDYLPAEVPSSE